MSDQRDAFGAALLLVAVGIACSPPGVAWARDPGPVVSTSDDPDREAGPVFHLITARSDVEAGRTRLGLDHLGLAETRLLNDRAATPGVRPEPFQRALTDVSAARAFASRGQRVAAIDAINDALRSLQSAEAATFAPVMTGRPLQLLEPMNGPAQSMPPAPPPPAVLYRLLPGHWQLRGAESVWVEPQSVPQPVSVETIVPSREIWNSDRWVPVPEHFTGGVPVR